jgi:hypothetical protein
MILILKKHRIAILINTVILATALANAADPIKAAQGPAPKPFGPAGDDRTTSMGSFKIKIVNKFAAFFGSCSYYNATSQILSSGTLFDPATIVGRSDVSLTGHDIANTPFEAGSVNVGMAGTLNS